jgi:hypothetical protein
MLHKYFFQKLIDLVVFIYNVTAHSEDTSVRKFHGSEGVLTYFLRYAECSYPTTYPSPSLPVHTISPYVLVDVLTLMIMRSYIVWERPPLWSSGQSSWLQKGYVLCFLWGTNLIYICYVEEIRPPLWSSGKSSWPQSGYVLCFLWGTNLIYICYVEEIRPPLWSSGQSSWLQIQRSGF